MRVLVTGATGFVGRAAVVRCLADGMQVTAATRRSADLPAAARQIRVGDIAADMDWRDAVRDCDAVLHLAARVHQMHDAASNPLESFREVNRDGSCILLSQAADAGVRRVVFVSSIKVNGESTRTGKPFTELDAPSPADPYGVSKAEAESALRELAARRNVELVIVRPPLVYGPGVKANFLNMIRWISRGLPLPLGGIRSNRRSLIGIDNLTSFLSLVLQHPAAANQTYLVSDGEDVSTSELLRRTAVAMGRRPLLLPLPAAWLSNVAALVGKGPAAQRLTASLQVDSTKARSQLGWRPVTTLDQGLQQTVDSLRDS